MHSIEPKTALISLSDKSGLEELVKFLVSKEVKMLSTGGTYKAIKEITSEVVEVSDFTGFEEMMDGRVKTLHPKIHAGILARRDQDMEILQQRGYETIDLVVVNLYPFKETIAQDCSFDEAIEKIDIGGPTMIRSAAKNFKDVAVVSNPSDYSRLIQEWENGDGISYDFRKELSQKVFETMADYNLSISNYLKEESENSIPNYSFDESSSLRYGENPHQTANLFTFSNLEHKNIANADILQGKELSYNNIVDADAAWECVRAFDDPACVIVKHANPCGVAESDDNYVVPREDLKCVTKREPTPEELNDLMFAWRVAKFVKSNAIVYVKNRQTIGIGAGQMSRVISADIANLKAKEEGLEVQGASMASDAFFPFRDGIDKAASSGISSIIQPGGSIRDDEVIAAADENDIAMVFTSTRHFRH